MKRVANSSWFLPGQTAGDKNVKWKGEEVGYFALHGWVYRILGRPNICDECGTTNNLEWANISKQYKRDLTDWKSLCAPCHRRFDGIAKLSREQAETIKYRYLNGETQRPLAREFGVSQMVISRLINGKTKYYA